MNVEYLEEIAPDEFLGKVVQVVFVVDAYLMPSLWRINTIILVPGRLFCLFLDIWFGCLIGSSPGIGHCLGLIIGVIPTPSLT